MHKRNESMAAEEISLMNRKLKDTSFIVMSYNTVSRMFIVRKHVNKFATILAEYDSCWDALGVFNNESIQATN